MRFFLLCLVLIAPWGIADVYKSVDKNGRVIYTDNPKDDKAQKMELREINTVPSAPPTSQSTPADSFKSQPAAISYQIKIMSPRNDLIIPVGQRDLGIAITVTPQLEEGHLLVYFMDGELLEETTQTNIIVKDAPRGIHTLAVEAIDADGRSLGTSAPVSVSLMRPIIKKAAPPVPTPK